MADNLKVAHIAIAVKSLQEAADNIRKIFGKELSRVEEVKTQNIRVQFVELGGVRFEFLEPMDAASPISKFIERRGGGIHHVSFDTEGLAKRLESLKTAGVPLIHENPVPGAEGANVAFLHPRALNGVLVEFQEHL